MDTYMLHEYFLFYSPVLIAASSILACMILEKATDLKPEIYSVFKGQILNKPNTGSSELMDFDMEDV